MFYSPNVWNQLKGLTVEEILSALKKDGWEQDPSSKGATLGYIKRGRSPNERVVIHYHPKKTYNAGLLKKLIADIGWTEEDLVRLKILKK